MVIFSIKEDINAIFGAIHINGSLLGVHSCMAMDWTILYEGVVDIINLDVYNLNRSLLPFARKTDEFLGRAGVMSYGIGPIYEVASEESIEGLLQKLGELWDKN